MIDIDKRIFMYVVIAGGITELLMRKTPDSVTRRKYAPYITIALAVGAAVLDGQILGLPISASIFKGLIAAAITSAGYDHIKTILVGFIKKGGA